MTQEIVRELVDGEWVTKVGTGGGGGGAQPVILSATDPGAIGRGKLWLDTSTDGPTLRWRNGNDTTWITVPQFALGIQIAGSGVEGEEAGIDGASFYRFPPFGGGFTIEHDGSKINVDTPLDMGGTGILASGDIDFEGDDILNVGTISPSSPPEVPAVPNAQDVVDALVTLGLVTQAS